MTAKKYELDISGDRYAGAPLQIVKAMQDKAFFDQALPLETYLDSLPEQLKKFQNVDITIAGSTLEERAESFIAELLRVGVAVEV
jgi:hypothetical protein